VRVDRKRALFLALSLTFFYFFLLGRHGLLDPDEGRYSEIPREMRVTGDYVTPRLNGVAYFEKPVLHYWLTASAQALFGENEFSGRFWPALLALAGAGATGLLGRRLYGTRCGFLAAFVLATSLLHFAVGQINITDMALSFFVTVALVAFKFAEEGSRGLLLIFYAAMALATLTKGLIGIVLPGTVLFWYIVLTRRWRLIGRALYLPGLVLFFALVLPWFIAVCRVNPDFFHFFFIQEHFLRYTTQMHERYEPFWFFFPILLVGLFPWAGFLPRALGRLLPGRKKQAGADELYLLLWASLILLFFSFSSSKLVPYIVPVLPPLAIAIARELDEALTGSGLTRLSLTASTLFSGLLGLAFLVYPFLERENYPLSLTLPAGLAVAFPTLAGLAAAWLFHRRRKPTKAVAALCLMGLFLLPAYRGLFLFYGHIKSPRPLAQAIAAHLEEDDIVAQFGTYEQALPFYLKRTNVVIGYRGELDYGVRRDSPSWFLDAEGLLPLLEGEKRVFLVIKRRAFEEFGDDLAGLFTLAEWDNTLVVVNRPLEVN
jgi:4-amino-4-deoxy-L-arabinose transferase-like glycosyltransferase